MRPKGFVIVVERDEDGMLVGTCTILRGCHSQAKDLTTLLKRMEEAIRVCLKVEKKPVRSLQFVGVQELTVAC